MRTSATALILLSAVPAALAQETDEHSVWTLFRSSVVDPGYVLHVATFDANEGNHYNKENCLIARDLFQSQPGVQVRYWCHPGWAEDAQGRKR